MDLTEVVIAPDEGSNRKGRSFEAICAAAITADSLWELGKRDDIMRPVFAVFLGSEGELRPFAANLTLGRDVLFASTANSRHNKRGYVFMRSAKYKQAWQREAEGSILTVYLPELFDLDPGMVDPEHARFIVLPSMEWAERQQGIPHEEIVTYALRLPFVKALNAPPTDDRGWRDPKRKHEPVLTEENLRPLVEVAYLFALRLDRCTRAPIPADGRFYMQVLLACLREGAASFATDPSSYRDAGFGCHKRFQFQTTGVEDIGFLPAVAFNAKHEEIERLLAEQVAIYFKLTKGK